MRSPCAAALITTALVIFAPPLTAQTAVDPSGHWEGSLQAQSMDIPLQVDLAKNSKGDLSGTVSVPAQKLKGLPLKVAIEGNSLTFHARADQPFRATLTADGKSMSGDFLLSGATLPFSLTRTGEARIEAPARSASIAKELEGTWTGTLDIDGGMRLVLTMANEPDGTATGTIVNIDQGGVEIPVVITQKGSSVTLDSTVVVSSFSGALSADGSELAGTFHQGPLEVPLTFRHGAATKDR